MANDHQPNTNTDPTINAEILATMIEATLHSDDPITNNHTLFAIKTINDYSTNQSV